ncbi:Hsp20/alpha crystallin family protein [Lysinibacillus sp. NPDC097231]|uniref:Hsp20/alpha crystallin family protein n=1 Tax=Lysinibacillus sp. NPDC097231 TaxID=3364142 RepID=UPI0037FD26E6
MGLEPYEPFKHLAKMRRDLDRLFSDFPFSFDNMKPFGGIRVDIHETDNELVATCHIPGLEKKEDIDIDIENNMLKISGIINRANENMHRGERYMSRFQHAISLPRLVDHEGISATYKNDLLKVKMPKLAKDNTKRINVEFK